VDYQEETLISDLNMVLEDMAETLKQKAWDNFQENIHPAKTLEEAKNIIINEKGIVSFSWCGDESCGKEIEEYVTVDILGVKDDANEGKCINCGKNAQHVALLAKTY
jgi:prolyl-tRNA synthetase